MDDHTIERVPFAYWINKSTNTESEYVITNNFPIKQWLRERASVLCLYHIASLFISQKSNFFFFVVEEENISRVDIRITLLPFARAICPDSKLFVFC